MSWFEDPIWLNSPRHIVSAAVVATDLDGRILLVRSPLRGWEMPGGQVEIGESLEAAAKREVLEESGIEVDDLVFCGVFQSLNKSIVNALFRARCSGGEVKPSAESLEVAFFAPDRALQLVTHSNFRERIALCLDPRRQPFFVAW